MQLINMAAAIASLRGVLASSRKLNVIVRRCSANKHDLCVLKRTIVTSTWRHCASAQKEEPLPLPEIDGQDKEYPEKLRKIVDEIARLSLSEVSSLTTLLRETLNIKDTPMMPMGGMMSNAAAAAPQNADPEPAKEEQTEFAIKLVKFEDGTKIKLIKEIKAILPEMNLVQAKKFVESAPKLVKEKATKEEAEKIKKQLETVGAVIELE